jgi:hypothetical protein
LLMLQHFFSYNNRAIAKVSTQVLKLISTLCDCRMAIATTLKIKCPKCLGAVGSVVLGGAGSRGTLDGAGSLLLG